MEDKIHDVYTCKCCICYMLVRRIYIARARIAEKQLKKELEMHGPDKLYKMKYGSIK